MTDKGPSPSIHELLVEKFQKPDAPCQGVISELSEATKALREACEKEQATTAAVMQDETKTAAARHMTAREVNQRIIEQATRRIDAANKKAAAELAALESTLAGPPAPKDSAAVAMAAEIRAAIARLDPDARAKAISDAIEAGDNQLLGAILHAPTLLTGLGQAEREARRASWQLRHAPAALDARERLEKAQRAANLAGSLAIVYVADLTDAKVVAAAQASARAAADAIKQATQ